MTTVFISYRRSDTQDLAGRLGDRLRAVDGISQVFIDVDGIEPGVNFVSKTELALNNSDVCILLIGERWRGVRPDGVTRIFEECDYVRQETAAALSGKCFVLPVLANNATMPAVNDLPPDLARLAQLNALSLRHADFQHDIEYLIKTLLGQTKEGQRKLLRRGQSVVYQTLSAFTGAAIAITLLVCAAVLHNLITKRSLDETLGGSGPVWLLILVTTIGGAVAGLFGGLRRRTRRVQSPSARRAKSSNGLGTGPH
jgi:hypothetical protein